LDFVKKPQKDREKYGDKEKREKEDIKKLTVFLIDFEKNNKEKCR